MSTNPKSPTFLERLKAETGEAAQHPHLKVQLARLRKGQAWLTSAFSHVRPDGGSPERERRLQAKEMAKVKEAYAFVGSTDPLFSIGRVVVPPIFRAWRPDRIGKSIVRQKGTKRLQE